MCTFAVHIAPEKSQSIVQVREVYLNWHEMNPGRHPIRVPLRINSRLENERIGRDQTFEAAGPTISVNLHGRDLSEIHVSLGG